MKRWLATALLFASSLAWAADDLYFDISDFHCGVDTYHSSLALNNCFVQDALNVYFDKDAPVVKRNGFTTFASSSSYAFTGLWSYTDASSNIWMVARSSDMIMATTGIGGTTFSVRIATVSANNVVNSVNAFGNAYFVDQTNGVYFWNGSSTTYINGAPKGSLIAQFHNRVWIAGLSSPQGNFLYGSKYLDGTTWATGINANDPVLFQVALNDNFDVITALFAGYNDIMYVFKNYSIQGLYGFDQSDFQMRSLNGEVGCIDQRSIQFFLGGLVFASARGIESFDGYTATRISDQVKNKVDPITLNSSFNQNSWTQQNAADWSAGSFNQTADFSTVIAAPSLVLSTFSHTASVAADWSGTKNALTVSGNSLKLTVANTNVLNYSYEDGSPDNWTLGSNGIHASGLTGLTCSVTPRTGSKLITSGSVIDGTFNITATLQTCGGSNLTTSVFAFATNSCTWSARTLSASAYSGRSLKVKFESDAGGSASTIMTSDCFQGSGTDITFYSASDQTRITFPPLYGVAIDDFTDGRNSISSGTYTSPTFNTAIPNNTIYPIAGWTVNTATPTFVLQGSNDGSAWTDLTTSTGITLTSTKAYLRYLSTFTWTTSLDMNSSLDSVSIRVSASSGAWTSQSHNISTATAFGNFITNQDTSLGGTLAYQICTANNVSMTGRSCVAATPNAQITASTNVYIQVISTFSVSYATETPKLNSFTLNWFTGTRKPPMASMVFDNRYWISITTDTTDSFDDATLVLSAGPLWTIFDIRAGAFVIWKNAPYFGNSFSSGYVYQLDQGQNDNGSAINAFIKTKDYAPGGLTMDKFFGKIHLVADNLGAYNIYTNYFIDRSTNAFSLGNTLQNETPGTLITKVQIPIDSTHMNFGKTISFKFQQNDVNAPFKFYGATLRYKPRRPQ